MSPELLAFIKELGPAALPTLACIVLWKVLHKQLATQSARIEQLEAAHDAHAEEYRELTSKVTEALTKNTDVMERVLETLNKCKQVQSVQ